MYVSFEIETFTQTTSGGVTMPTRHLITSLKNELENVVLYDHCSKFQETLTIVWSIVR